MVHSYLQTDCMMFTQHSNLHMDEDYCWFHEMKSLYVTIAVNLSIDFYYENYFTMLINSNLIGGNSVNIGR